MFLSLQGLAVDCILVLVCAHCHAVNIIHADSIVGVVKFQDTPLSFIKTLKKISIIALLPRSR
jgi:hypothetical protein